MENEPDPSHAPLPRREASALGCTFKPPREGNERASCREAARQSLPHRVVHVLRLRCAARPGLPLKPGRIYAARRSLRSTRL
jgi:hypothetical protein